MTAALFQQPQAAAHARPPLEGLAGQLATCVIDTVKHAAATAPRSLQAAPGPSELGTPCHRRLACKIIGAAQPNSDTDPWAATIGTATHAWLADAYQARNKALGRQRYLIEHRVKLPYGISGSTDLYDREWQLNNDWKITSLDNLRKYRRDGPGDQYRTQAHLYGLGLQLQGEDPAHVAITFLPRGGRIDQLHVWSEPYDPAVAVAALARYDHTVQYLAHSGADAWPARNPAAIAALPTADAHCTYCPYFLPRSADPGKGCPGHRAAPPAAVTIKETR